MWYVFINIYPLLNTWEQVLRSKGSRGSRVLGSRGSKSFRVLEVVEIPEVVEVPEVLVILEVQFPVFYIARSSRVAMVQQFCMHVPIYQKLNGFRGSMFQSFTYKFN